MSPALRTAALIAAAAVLGLAIRLGSWSAVFDGGEVWLLADTDPHYHVLHAQRMAAGTKGATWFDPRLDWPNGARVPWPPLFDALLASAARAASPSAPSVAEVARVAVFVPPILGALGIVVAGLLGVALAGRAAGAVAAFAVALLPSHVAVSILGRVDQHPMEVLLSLASWWAFVVAWRDGLRRRSAAAGGVILALAFWNWMGSALVLCFPAGATAVLWVAGSEAAVAAAGAFAISSGVGALLLAVSIALVAPPGALGESGLLGVTGLHVAILAGCMGFGGLLVALARWRRTPPGPARRLAEVAVALVIPAAVLLGALPGVREGALHGLRVLGASGAWYGNIGEFRPLIGSGTSPLVGDLRRALDTYGLVPVLALAGAPALVSRWRASPGERATLTVVALWAATGLVLSQLRFRLGPYGVALLAIAFAAEWDWMSRAAGKRFGRLAGAALLVGAAALALMPALPALAQPAYRVQGPVVDALRWLREQPVPPNGASGVAADWEMGHLIQYFADRPALVTPFGTEAGGRAMADWAALAFAQDEETALSIAERRRLGWVVLHDSTGALQQLHAFAPPGTPPAIEVSTDWRRGPSARPLPGLLGTLYFQLLAGDGLVVGRPFERLRLIHETGTGFGPWQMAKVFGVVSGATVRIAGGSPGGQAAAELPLRTVNGRTLLYRRAVTFGPDGSAELRVPYATGANGTTLAGPLQLEQGGRRAVVSISERAVVEGGRIEARLGVAR